MATSMEAQAKQQQQLMQQLNLPSIRTRITELQSNIDRMMMAFQPHIQQKWPDALAQFSVVNAQLFALMEDVHHILRMFVAYPSLVTAENSQILPIMLSSKLLPDMEQKDEKLKAEETSPLAASGLQSPDQIKALQMQIDAIDAACEAAEKVLAGARAKYGIGGRQMAPSAAALSWGPPIEKSTVAQFLDKEKKLRAAMASGDGLSIAPALSSSTSSSPSAPPLSLPPHIAAQQVVVAVSKPLPRQPSTSFPSPSPNPGSDHTPSHGPTVGSKRPSPLASSLTPPTATSPMPTTEPPPTNPNLKPNLRQATPPGPRPLTVPSVHSHPGASPQATPSSSSASTPFSSSSLSTPTPSASASAGGVATPSISPPPLLGMTPGLRSHGVLNISSLQGPLVAPPRATGAPLQALPSRVGSPGLGAGPGGMGSSPNSGLLLGVGLGMGGPLGGVPSNLRPTGGLSARPVGLSGVGGYPVGNTGNPAVGNLPRSGSQQGAPGPGLQVPGGVSGLAQASGGGVAQGMGYRGGAPQLAHGGGAVGTGYQVQGQGQGQGGNAGLQVPTHLQGVGSGDGETMVVHNQMKQRQLHNARLTQKHYQRMQ